METLPTATYRYDNRAEGYRLSAMDPAVAGYDLLSLELVELGIMQMREAAEAAEGERTAAWEAELEKRMEAQLLQGARGEGMDHDDEERSELEPWGSSA